MPSEILTVDPSTGKTLERFAYLTEGEVDDRLDAAVAAFSNWRRNARDNHAAFLQSVSAQLRSDRQTLAETAVREMGKPIGQTLAEVDKCAWCCDYFAEHAATLLAERPVESNAARSAIAFRPLGVLFAIMPWNFPYWQVFRAAIPAIAAGNAVVVK